MAPLYDGGGNVSHVPAAGDVGAVFAECIGGARGALGLAVLYDPDALHVDFLGVDFWVTFGPADGCALFVGDSGALGGRVFMVVLCLVGMGLARELVPFFPELQRLDFRADDRADHQGEAREFAESGEAFSAVFHRRHGGLALRERLGEFSGVGSFRANGANRGDDSGGDEPLVFSDAPGDPAHRSRESGLAGGSGLEGFWFIAGSGIAAILCGVQFVGDSERGAFHDHAELARGPRQSASHRRDGIGSGDGSGGDGAFECGGGAIPDSVVFDLGDVAGGAALRALCAGGGAGDFGDCLAGDRAAWPRLHFHDGGGTAVFG